MEEARAAQDTSKKSEHRPTKGMAWVVMTWGRIVIGMGLAGEGAWMYAHARINVEGSVWMIGAATALAGALLSFSGVQALYRNILELRAARPFGREPAIPKLGALLVYRYDALTEEQLELALKKQREDPEEERRLGEILIDMGFISEAQLTEALAHQAVQAKAKSAKAQPA
ncbi:MAG: hypothetical protein MUQ65_08480 [Armatimonadetes bacterium]|nr:hypothetical protein [Armatimonadota bacterium]